MQNEVDHGSSSSGAAANQTAGAKVAWGSFSEHFKKRQRDAALSFHGTDQTKKAEKTLYKELHGHTGRVTKARTFEQDSIPKVLTCSDDSTLRIWNLETAVTAGAERVFGCDNTELLEHRRSPKQFPDVLGPYGIQETVLKPTIDFEKQEYTLRKTQDLDWIGCVAKERRKPSAIETHPLARDERGSLSKELWAKLFDHKKEEGELKGRLSKPHAITLLPSERAPYGIPSDATHFLWGHQLDAVNERALTNEEITQLGAISSEASFVVNGGFVYVDMKSVLTQHEQTGEWICGTERDGAPSNSNEWWLHENCKGQWKHPPYSNGSSTENTTEGKHCTIHLNAICAKGLMTLHFGEKVPVIEEKVELNETWKREAIKSMIEEERFQPVGIVSMREEGARFYCWLFPAEKLHTKSCDDDEDWAPTAGGGFMYICNKNKKWDDNKCPPEILDHPETTCFYYEHTVGHMQPVRSCCVLTDPENSEQWESQWQGCVPKDPEHILSCSEDGTLRKWDIKTGVVKKVVVVVNHREGCTGAVADCCEFWNAGGKQRVLSCAEDELQVWDLESYDPRTNKEPEFTLCCHGQTGHTSAVLSCCAFPASTGAKAVSASLKEIIVWDLSSNCHPLIKMPEGGRSCSVFGSPRSDEWKALTCGGDNDIKLWDLRSSNPEAKLLQAHTKEVVEVCTFGESEGGWWGLSSSADGSTRAWKLGEEEQGEWKLDLSLSVDSVAPSGCAISVPVVPSEESTTKIITCVGDVVRVWNLDLLGGAALQAEDIQDDTSGESHELDMKLTISQGLEDPGQRLWKWWHHMTEHNHKAWALSLVKDPGLVDRPEKTMQLLYGRHRDGLTLLHKLAEEPDGGYVLRYLLKHLKEGRQMTQAGRSMGAWGPVNEASVRNSIAEMSIGMVCRAGLAHGKSLIRMASDKHNHFFVEALLEDYRMMVTAVVRNRYSNSTIARYDLFEPMIESDLVDLFVTFPLAASAFTKDLQLRPTAGPHLWPKDKEMILDHSGKMLLGSDHMIVKSSKTMDGKNDEEGSGAEGFWYKIVQAGRLAKDKGKTKKKMTPFQTHLVPIMADSIPNTETHLPFSQLLQSSYDHAVEYDTVDLFDAPILRAIIHHKWHTVYQHLFWVAVFCSLLWTMCLTVVLVDGGQGSAEPFLFSISRWVCWVCWFPVGFFTLVQLFFFLWRWANEHLINNGCMASCGQWLQTASQRRLFELLGILVLGLGLGLGLGLVLGFGLGFGLVLGFGFALGLDLGVAVELCIHVAAGVLLGELEGWWDTNSWDWSGWMLFPFSRQKTMKAMLLFLVWARLCRWLTGFEQLFFTMKVINTNFKTLLDFAVVLIVVLFAYGLAFFMVLRSFVDAYEIVHSSPGFAPLFTPRELNHTSSYNDIDGVISSVIHAFGMMQGEFDTQVFETPWRKAIQSRESYGVEYVDGFLIVLLWASFMFLVPIVMVNILIASMQNSYDAVFAKRDAHMLMERATLILQLESVMQHLIRNARGSDQKLLEQSMQQGGCCSDPCNCWKGVCKVVLSKFFPADTEDQILSGFLHVLSSSESGLHAGVDKRESHPPGRVEKMGNRVAQKQDQLTVKVGQIDVSQKNLVSEIAEMKTMMAQLLEQSSNRRNSE